MAEALATVGVVASIVQLIDFSARVVRRLEQFHSNAGEIPKSLRHINTELPVLRTTLDQILQAIEANSLGNGARDTLIPAVDGCREQIEQLDAILAKTLPATNDGWRTKSKKAIVSLHQDNKVESITKILRNYIATLTFYYTAASSTLQPLTDAKLAKIRQWLSAPDPSTNYQKALKQRQDDTGLWFLESDQYAAWKTDAASFLWLHGIPGCGKTILSSTILRNVLQHCNNDPGKVVAYFYFDFNDAQKQNPELMLRSLICQLSQHCVKIPTSLDTLFTSCESGQRQPNLHALVEVIRQIIQEFPHVYIVLDALDECAERSELTEILETTATWQLQNLHVLVTSRRERDVEKSLETFIDRENIVCLQSELVDMDIQKYVRQRLSNDRSLSKWQRDATVRREIEAALMKGAHGMFRWAVCQLDTLAKCLNRAMLRKSLAALPPTLDKTYDRILCAISGDYYQYAVRILRWLTFSARPLSVDEVAEMVAIDADRKPAFDREEVLEDPLDVLDVCSSLISMITDEGDRILEPPRQIVVLAHYSVKEYLLSGRIWKGSAAHYGMQSATCHDAIAKGCLGYLLQFQRPELLSQDAAKEFKLAEYSAKFWMYHAQGTEEQTEGFSHVAMDLLSEKSHAYLNWLRIHDPDELWKHSDFQKDLGSVPSPLYYVSLSGLRKTTELLLDKDADANAQGGRYGNALQAASAGGYEQVVKLLLDKDADVNARGGQHGNALQAASAGGYEQVVKLLLEAGAEINTPGGYYGSALYAAIVEGHEDTVGLLLENGANVTGLDAQLKGAMHHAVNNAYCKPSLVTLLLDRGALMNTVDINNMTPLHYCVKFGHKVVAKLLLDRGVLINSGVHRKTWMIHKAVGDGTTCAESASDSTPEVPRISAGLTPLHFATLTGDPAMTEFLLKHDADPNALSEYGESPLHLALCTTLYGTKYQDDWVDPYLRTERLLDFIDFEEDDVDAILADISRHRIAVLEALLSDPRTSLTVKDYKGEYPLHCIRYNQPESTTVIQKLVSKGIDLFYGNSKQQTALHFASLAGDHESVIVLLSFRAELTLTLTDNKGLNALHYASQSGNYETMTAILENDRVKAVNLVASTDRRGMNALHHLLSTSPLPQVETVQLLLSHGLEGSELDESGAPPLASYFRSFKFTIDIEICRLLLGIKGTASFVDNNGQTLGHLCAGTFDLGVHVLKVLKEHGVDMTKRDLEGRTVLHRAAICGSLTKDSLEFLVDVIGLQPSAEDSCGKAALQYATELATKNCNRGILDADRWKRTKDILLQQCPASIA